MITSFIRTIRGYVRVSVSVSNPESFVNALRCRIPVWDIKKADRMRISFTIPLGAMDFLMALAARYGTTPEILSRKGLPVFLGKYKKRIGLLFGFLMGLVLLYASTLFVWDIQVEGNENVAQEEIVEVLRYLGFKEGSFIPAIDLDRLHNAYLIEDPRLSWIAVNFNGTVAHVEVKEAVPAPERVDKETLCNIVASRDGVIVRVDALDGGKEVLPGEAVTKGQLLISAFMETRKSGTILRSAKGNVYATTFRNFQIDIPYSVLNTNRTGSELKQYSLQILGRELPLHFDRKHPYDAYDKSVTREHIVLFGRIRLPIRLVTETYGEYEVVPETLSQEQARGKAYAEMKRWMAEELGEAEILSRQVTEQPGEECFRLICELECLENIAKSVPIVNP